MRAEKVPVGKKGRVIRITTDHTMKGPNMHRRDMPGTAASCHVSQDYPRGTHQNSKLSTGREELLIGRLPGNSENQKKGKKPGLGK
jgi:hypothetical protein